MMEKMKEKVGMRFVLGFLLFILCVTASSCNDIDRFFRGKDGHTNKREKESKETGRFQIHGTPRGTLLFDPTTGRTWILESEKGEYKWTYVLGGADIDPAGILTEDERRQKMMKGVR